jgi:hypothetical protein
LDVAQGTNADKVTSLSTKAYLNKQNITLILF